MVQACKEARRLVREEAREAGRARVHTTYPRESGSRAPASCGGALMEAKKNALLKWPVEPVSMVGGVVGPQIHCQVSPSHILCENFMLEIFLTTHITTEHECSAFVSPLTVVPPAPRHSQQLTPWQERKGCVMVHPHLPGKTS